MQLIDNITNLGSSAATATWYALLGLLLAATPVFAQSEAPYAEAINNEILLRGEVAEDGVRLLWMPLRENGFYASLPAGFVLERYAAGVTPAADNADWSRDVSIATPQAWRRFPDKDLYEDLYSFAPDSTATPLATSPGEETYGLTLMALGTDYRSTQLAGFAYVDSTAERGTSYTYVLRRASELLGSTAPVLATLGIATDTITRYPAPVIDTAVRESRQLVKVSWDRAETDASYDAYFVERAELTGANELGPWSKVSPLPLLQLYTEGFVDTLQYYADSTADNNRDFAYRVQGLTGFGHYGTVSDTVVLRANPDPLLDQPVITVMTRVVDTLFRVVWTPGEADADSVELAQKLTAWRVYTSEQVGVDLQLVGDSSLAPGTRSVVLVDPPDGSYVTVEAIDRNGVASASDPKILRAVDKRPPAPPKGLTGAIDSSGSVTLTWAANTEIDVLGYRVFRSNRDTGYFPQLTPNATPFANWADSVSMQMASEEVYYRVAAEDYAGNQSEYSAVLTLKRPDLFPPVEPVIRSYSGSTEAVTFEVARSSSPDVVEQIVQRRPSAAADTSWQRLASLTDTAAVVTFVDSSGRAGVAYDYRILATDDAQLSTPSRLLTAARTKDPVRAPVEDFNVELLPGTEQPTLSWRYPAASRLRGFQLYRIELAPGADLGADLDEVEFKALALLSPNDKELRLRAGRFYYVDGSVKPGSRYAYRLYARYFGGGFSEFTAPITVSTP